MGAPYCMECGRVGLELKMLGGDRPICGGCRPVARDRLRRRRFDELVKLDSRLAAMGWQARLARSNEGASERSSSLLLRRIDRIRLLVAERLTSYITYGEFR